MLTGAEMATDMELPTEVLIYQLLEHLGIQQAHFGAGVLGDWQGLVRTHADRILSLTLLSPQGFDVEVLRPIGDRLLVITGDSGPVVRNVPEVMLSQESATHVTLQDCFNAIWTDLTGDRAEEIGDVITDFLIKAGKARPVGAANLPQGEGEFGGIAYQVRGVGPPLVLLPLALMPSQWEPVIPRLAEEYCTVTLNGAYLGSVRNHEERARGRFRLAVRNFVEELQIQDGETILDVGCGSGVHDRYLAKVTGGKNPITAIDQSAYLLKEAKGIARSQGLEHLIDFREGDAEALPFPDNSFDVVVSITVMEEVNADKMVAELVRVTKPGGRVGVIIRAVDLPFLINVPVSVSIKQKVEAPGVMGDGVSEGGCGDASLYLRLKRAGLSHLSMFPQMSLATTGGPYIQQWLNLAFNVLNSSEQEELREAVAQSQSEGTFFITNHVHCAIGTKP
jgi:ubiquinone/menaquinone biosynthesis C-methylase UbiE